MATRNRSIKDRTGEKYGRLTALSLVERREDRAHIWRWQCECGAQKDISIKCVRSGHTKSCGCLAKEVLRSRNMTHGLSKKEAKTYKTWKDARARCYNENNQDYMNYGGRGIKMSPSWDSFESFFECMGPRPAGMTLDRIDTNGDYEPGNCRWADPKTQANNKRTNRKVGELGNLVAVSAESGIERTKLAYRLGRGYTHVQALAKVDYRKCKPQE